MRIRTYDSEHTRAIEIPAGVQHTGDIDVMPAGIEAGADFVPVENSYYHGSGISDVTHLEYTLVFRPDVARVHSQWFVADVAGFDTFRQVN